MILKLYLKRSHVFLFAALIVLNLFLVGVFVQRWTVRQQRAAVANPPPGVNEYPEIDELASNAMDFAGLEQYFKNLAKSKGAAYAFEVLKIAPIPPNIDLHLLGHIVGDVLYQQEGAEGITVCTEDFRNACSHSIVIGLFTEKEDAALPEIAQACREAPGGKGAYTMCFHGLGHGILAYFGYDMEKAVAICKKTGTPQYSHREYIECVGGTVMEIIGGGFHDREFWAAQRKKYLSSTDPTSLCLSEFMPYEARPQCFVYLTPYLWEAAGGNVGSPTPRDHAQAFEWCKKIPESDHANRNACYGGFGKEFVVLVQDRDIRSVKEGRISNEQLGSIYEWCLLAVEDNGIVPCMLHTVSSLYWGGENDWRIAVRFCTLIERSNHQSLCFRELIGAVAFYISDLRYRQEFCGALPPAYRDECGAQLVK